MSVGQGPAASTGNSQRLWSLSWMVSQVWAQRLPEPWFGPAAESTHPFDQSRNLSTGRVPRLVSVTVVVSRLPGSMTPGKSDSQATSVLLEMQGVGRRSRSLRMSCPVVNELTGLTVVEFRVAAGPVGMDARATRTQR